MAPKMTSRAIGPGLPVRVCVDGFGAGWVPGWALGMCGREVSRRRITTEFSGEGGIEVVVRAGEGAALVSVVMEGGRGNAEERNLPPAPSWKEGEAKALDGVVAATISASLDGLRETEFVEPVRLWNFLPGICEPMGEGLDRYRVFNRARHRVFGEWFGEGAVRCGSLPTASCVGHHGNAISIHALGMRTRATPVENPRQIPAFAYSTKFGPRPPCFSRAGVVTNDGRRLLFVAGTASVRGEESVFEGSLEDQCRETVVNLDAVISAGRAAAGNTKGDTHGAGGTFDGLLASRIYYRNTQDRSRLAELLPRELVECGEVEFVHADICREELLVEIEVALDVGRG